MEFPEPHLSHRSLEFVIHEEIGIQIERRRERSAFLGGPKITQFRCEMKKWSKVSLVVSSREDLMCDNEASRKHLVSLEVWMPSTVSRNLFSTVFWIKKRLLSANIMNWLKFLSERIWCSKALITTQVFQANGPENCVHPHTRAQSVLLQWRDLEQFQAIWCGLQGHFKHGGPSSNKKDDDSFQSRWSNSRLTFVASNKEFSSKLLRMASQLKVS